MSYSTFAILLIVGGAIPSTLFVAYYGLAAPWWRSAEGVHLFGFTATIALLLDLSLAARAFGIFPGLRAAALVIYAAIAVFMWQRLMLVLRAQRRRNDRNTTEEPPHGLG